MGILGGGGGLNGFQGSTLAGIEREEEEKEKEEEERRGNKAEVLLNCNRDHSLHHFLVLCSLCNCQLVLFLGI